MMKRLSDEDLRAIKALVESGHLRVSEHPAGGLFIYNYTEKTAFDRYWDKYTLQCRGLIVDAMGYAVARGMKKFFNYGESSAPEVGPFDICSAHDKMDGSLGIAYPDHDGKMSIATRGSFKSDQAVKATEILRTKYPTWAPLNPLMTSVFEIIYPENRIVLDYGLQEDLVFLGLVDNEHGTFFPYRDASMAGNWSGPKAEMIRGAVSLEGVLRMPPRPNKEGLVLRFIDGQMLKIKQEDYVQLHRIVTNITPKSVWQQCLNGTLDDLLPLLPPSFAEDVSRQADAFWVQRTLIERQIRDEFDSLVTEYGSSRGQFASYAKTSKYSGMLFQLLDGKDISVQLWMAVKPTSEAK